MNPIRRALAAALHNLATRMDDALVELTVDDHDGMRTITVNDGEQRLRSTYPKDN